MEKKHIITIAGLPGSGKSSAAAGSARELGYAHFSSGDLFRKMAAERGISLEEMNFEAEKQKAIDRSVDEFLRALGNEKENFVIDSRTAFHWMPASFKIFLKIDLAIAVERMFAQVKAGDRVGQAASSSAEMLEKTLARVESEKKRFSDLYGIDFTDPTNYDLIIDTGTKDLRQVVDAITGAYHKWLGNSIE